MPPRPQSRRRGCASAPGPKRAHLVAALVTGWLATAGGCGTCSDAEPQQERVKSPAAVPGGGGGGRTGEERADPPRGAEAAEERGAETADEALTAALEACRTQDGEALWGLLGEAFRADIRSTTERMGVLEPATVAEAHGYEEPVDELTPRTYLTITLHSDEEHENPCWRADEWEELARDDGDARRGILFRLPSGRGRGVVLERRGERWLVAKITRSLRPEQYQTVVPGYAPQGR